MFQSLKKNLAILENVKFFTPHIFQLISVICVVLERIKAFSMVMIIQQNKTEMGEKLGRALPFSWVATLLVKISN